MTDPGATGWLAHLASPGWGEDEGERVEAERILDLVRRLAAHQAPILPAFEQSGSASLTAMGIGIEVARQLPPRPESLVVVEIGAAVLAAPWLSDERGRRRALALGLRAADQLLPPGDLDVGRDTGTWGAIAGAMAIAADRAPKEIAVIASSAASLVLAPVSVTHADGGYCALRVGHASASALLAVAIVDSGFVGDPQAIDELRDRLGVAGAPAETIRPDRIARIGIRAMEDVIP